MIGDSPYVIQEGRPKVKNILVAFRSESFWPRASSLPFNYLGFRVCSSGLNQLMWARNPLIIDQRLPLSMGENWQAPSLGFGLLQLWPPLRSSCALLPSAVAFLARQNWRNTESSEPRQLFAREVETPLNEVLVLSLIVSVGRRRRRRNKLRLDVLLCFSNYFTPLWWCSLLTAGFLDDSNRDGWQSRQ